MARPNPEAERKAKEKKQKMIAAVGGVLLLALLGLQGPKVLGKLHQKPPPLPGNVLPPNGYPPGQAPPSLAAPTLGGSGGTTSATSAGGGGGGGGGGTNPAAGNGPASKLAVFEVAPDPADGQLRTFSRFVSKDPFQQQIKVDASGNEIAPSGGGSSSSGSGSSSSGGSTSSGGGASSGSGSSTGSTGGGTTQPGAPTAVSAVKIRINDGAATTVSVGSDFPSDNPSFHLLSATSVSARVTIAGGSYADGRSSVTLRVGKPVTLENTADGTRYKLVLVGPG